jgi:tetratricopeptide (TPR) repeat protein
MRRGLLAALLLAGCGYYSGYNGIYHANKFAEQARESEAQGRPGEAQNLWGQAAVKAESLLARQPRGKWRNDALAIRGEALSSLGRCSEASVYLREAQEYLDDRTAREQAALALGRCELVLGQPALAAATLEPIEESGDDYRRTEARRLRGRALVLTGDYETALADLIEAGAAPTSGEVLGALAGLGRTEEVNAAIDQLIVQRDSAMRWDSVISVVADRNPAMGSEVLERLRAAGVVRSADLPALLGADAARLSGAARDRRLEELVRIAPQTDAGDAGHLELTRRHLQAVGTPAELLPLVDTLAAIASKGMGSAPAAERLAARASSVARVADSVTAGMPQGDLHLFLAGEAARDSLGAPTLATSLFRRVVDEWPDGDYAAKALLAGRQLDPAWAAQTDSLIEGRYAGSPYVVAARGGDRTALLRLEDSLAAFERVVSGRPAEAARPSRGRARIPTTQPVSGSDDVQAKRPTPTRGRQVEDLK